MAQILLSAPEIIKRGTPFRGSCSISLDSEVACREIAVYLECVVAYENPCVPNFGTWWAQEFKTVAGIANGKLKRSSFDFEFSVPELAPPTHAGANLSCRWFLKTKIDIPMTADINQSREIRVER